MLKLNQGQKLQTGNLFTMEDAEKVVKDLLFCKGLSIRLYLLKLAIFIPTGISKSEFFSESFPQFHCILHFQTQKSSHIINFFCLQPIYPFFLLLTYFLLIVLLNAIFLQLTDMKIKPEILSFALMVHKLLNNSKNLGGCYA